MIRTFCGRCGTPLTYRRASQPETLDFTTVTLDRPEDFPPTKEIWLEHKLPWERANDTLKQYPRSSVQTSDD